MYPYKLEAIIFVCFHHVISHNSFAFPLNSLITSVDYLLPDFIAFEVPRTQPLICVGCSVHYWVSCAINKGSFFDIAFFVVVDTHLPRFEAIAYVLPHFDELTHVVIRASSAHHSSV